MNTHALIEYYCNSKDITIPSTADDTIDILRRMVIIGLVEQNEYDEYVGELSARHKQIIRQ